MKALHGQTGTSHIFLQELYGSTHHSLVDSSRAQVQETITNVESPPKYSLASFYDCYSWFGASVRLAHFKRLKSMMPLVILGDRLSKQFY